MDNSENANKMSFTDKWAICIVGLSVIVLLACVGCYVCCRIFTYPRPTIIQIHIVPSAATLNKKEICFENVDTLVHHIDDLKYQIENKCNAVIEQRAQDDAYKTFGTLFFGIVVSICGFFGFKSFKDIKEKGVQTAREAANEYAGQKVPEIAERKTQEYLNTQLPTVVRQELDGHYTATYTESLKQSILQTVDSKLEELKSMIQQESPQEATESAQERDDDTTADEMFNGVSDTTTATVENIQTSSNVGNNEERSVAE